jgi:trk system potassium uptake protein TrkA
VIEAQVLGTSPISGKLIKDIAFPEGTLVGAVMQDNKIVKPAGNTRIDEGDVITIFALAVDVPEVERLLQVSIDFF